MKYTTEQQELDYVRTIIEEFVIFDKEIKRKRARKASV
jgi:hypothetical protein